MLRLIFKSLFFLLVFFITLFSPVSLIFAQENSSPLGLGIANYLIINDKNVKDGDIIVLSRTGYHLSTIIYDPMIAGVVAENPAISVVLEIDKKTYPVVSSGTVMVNVTTSNGAIKPGDPITTSAIPGAAMKATKSGYVIGTSIDSFTSNNPKEIGKVAVSLNISYLFSEAATKSSMNDIFNLSSIAAYEEPLTVLKYITAALIVILSFFLGLFSFGRVASVGLEALGRNPLAGRIIQFSIFLNVLISIAIIAAGLIIGLLIIML